MAIKVRSPKDMVAGVMFCAFGAIGLRYGFDYPLGRAAQMGPGYFPVLLSSGLLILGVIIGLRGLRREGEALDAIGWRALLCVLGAILYFGFTIDRFGLIVAVAGVALLMALAQEERRWGEVLISAVLMSAFCVAVFIYGLEQQFRIWIWQ